MGGSSKKSTSSKKEEPAIPGTGAMMTQPAFLPGNDTMLAEQLAAGGYGSAPDLLAAFQQTFTPMQLLDTRPGANPAPTTPPASTPTTPTTVLDKWLSGSPLWRGEGGAEGALGNIFTRRSYTPR